MARPAAQMQTILLPARPNMTCLTRTITIYEYTPCLLPRFYPGVPDDLRPLGGVGLDDRRELVRRIAGAVDADLCELLAHVRLRRDLRCLLVELAHDRRGRPGRRQQPEPGDGLETRYP